MNQKMNIFCWQTWPPDTCHKSGWFACVTQSSLHPCRSFSSPKEAGRLLIFLLYSHSGKFTDTINHFLCDSSQPSLRLEAKGIMPRSNVWGNDVAVSHDIMTSHNVMTSLSQFSIGWVLAGFAVTHTGSCGVSHLSQKLWKSQPKSCFR